MSETKRRARGEKTSSDPTATTSTRKIRVTLTKDVSSKYRKIIPKSSHLTQSPGRFRRSAADPVDPTAPAAFRRPRPESFGPTRSFQPRSRPYDGRPSHPAFGRNRPQKDPTTPFLAVINRELPEATKQVREIKNLIQTTADDILNLLEVLSNIHQNLGATLKAIKNYPMTETEPLKPVEEHTEKTQYTVGQIFEKMNFQDLVTQRLLKVEGFLNTLNAAFKPKAQTGQSHYRQPAKNIPTLPQKNELKGPQSSGDELDQNHINDLLAGL